MKEEIYRWVKTIAFFYIVFSAVLHLVPDVKYERLYSFFHGNPSDLYFKHTCF